MSQPPSYPTPEQPGQPYPGQPYQGQPYPGQPQPDPSYPGQPGGAAGGYPPPAPSGQPGYPPPGQPYPGQPQPGQPQPGQPQPGFPGGPQFDPAYPGAVPPKKKSSALKIILIVLAVLALLCVGGITVAFFAVKDKVSDVVDGSKVSLVEPATLGGRAKSTDPALAPAVTELKNALSSAQGTTQTVGGLYGDPAKQDIVMVAAAKAPVLDPPKELDKAIADMSSGGGGLAVTDVVTVDAGPLGGNAKCGNSETSGVKLAVCAWADNGSVGVIAVFFKTVDDVKADFVSMRGEIEKK
jgi:hypothetical protein